MADLNARARDGERPMDLAQNDEMIQVIVNEEKRRRDHGFKRSVIPPNPPTLIAELASMQLLHEGDEEGQGHASASAVVETEGHGQANASSVA